MKKNDCFPMKCENLGADMEGVCRHEGMAVFVPGLLPGEEAIVRIVKVEKRFAFGRIEQLSGTPSPDREQPDCPVFPRCGGCSCRHMTYEATLEAKRRQVADCFLRIAGLPVDVPDVIGMSSPYGYRNKTALPVSGTADAPALGFYAPRSHTVIPISSCPNALPQANQIAKIFLSWMKSHALAPYQEETHTGLIRHLVIRVNQKGESMVTVVINGNRLPFQEELTALLRPAGVISLFLNINSSRTNVILSDSFHLLYGKETLRDYLCGLSYELSPAAFFQINPQQTEKLYRTALDFADLQPENTLCDVYCGAGTISLMMARSCRSVVGIEVVPSAVENARRNASANGVTNAVFHAGKAEELLPALVEKGLRSDVIVVDPPRKGLDPAVIHAISSASPARVVYVSCNPATLARDVKGFSDLGYQIKKVQPVDMFCWTSGVETVVLLSKLKSTCCNKVPKCPPVKERAIEDALRPFQMIHKEET